MTHTKGNVIQYNEYYPFGLQTANSWTRENNTGNNFLGNGGTELNATSNLYDLHYRNYDPTLGRMTQVDPLADNYGSISTYNFAFNDPVYYNDPLGDSPIKDINDSRTADIQRNQANSYRPIGDDMYGSAFDKYGPGDRGALSSLTDPIVQRLRNIQHTKQLIGQAWDLTNTGSNKVFFTNAGEIVHWVSFKFIGPGLDVDTNNIFVALPSGVSASGLRAR
jgi:RHS repeat-associated protein